MSSDAQISAQAGLLTGGFTGAQVLTAILWGKIADSPKFYGGRKMVLLIGTLGTSIACFGYGFSTTFAAAMFWRILAGTINGLVGIIRTMISEITVERKYQSRAFLILPMSFNVAGILGPILGGWLANPAVTLPAWFGPGAPFASALVQNHPFALPSIVNALALFAVFLAVLFGLEETSKSKKGAYDCGLHAAARVKAFVLRREVDYVYRDCSGYEQLEMQQLDQKVEKPLPVLPGQKKKATLPFRRLWTKNVVFTLLSQALYDFHLGAFTNIWTLFLSTPRPGLAPASLPTADSGTLGKRNLLWFAGGLGMPSSTVGNATSILGVLGMLLQVVMYPPVHARLGTLRSFRYFLVIFPVAYLLVPFLATLPQAANADGSAGTGVSTALWFAIVFILFLHTSARTMTLPASIILLNNCSPHPSVLGTIHGLGQSVSAGFRTVGPIVGGWWYGMGLDWGMVAFSWWAVAAASLVGSVASLLIYEGTGKEIQLEDEDEE